MIQFINKIYTALLQLLGCRKNRSSDVVEDEYGCPPSEFSGPEESLSAPEEEK